MQCKSHYVFKFGAGSDVNPFLNIANGVEISQCFL